MLLELEFMQLQNSSLPISIFIVWKSLKRRWRLILAIFCTPIVIAAIATTLQKPIYSAEGKLSFRRSSSTPTLTGLGKEVSELSSLREQSSPIDTEAEIIRSYPIAGKTIALLDLKDGKGNSITFKDFAKRLKITAVKGTDIIQINYEDLDPNNASNVVNTVMKLYLEQATENYRQIAANAIQFLEKQRPIAEEQVKKAELELRYFREQNKVVSLEEEQRSSVQFLFSLQNELKTAQSQLSDAEEQLKAIQSRLGVSSDRAVSNAVISQSKGVQDLLADKQKIESQLAIESTRYQNSHPIIQVLQSQLTSLNVLLQKRVDLVNNNNFEGQVGNPTVSSLKQDFTQQIVQLEAKRSGLEGQILNMLDLEKQYTERIDKLPKLEQQQRELNRRLDATQSTYSLLLKKLGELRVVEEQNSSNATIVVKALPPQEALGSNKVLLIVSGILLGSILAIATAIFLDSRDRSIQTVEDAIQAFNFPMLGEIPLVEEHHNVLAIAVGKTLPSSKVDASKELEPNPLIRDASHLIGLNLKVLNIKKSIKVITVTSVEDQEGKSTLAAYLAASLANLGEKVVLVDANLHSPSQHRHWYHLGLSDVLFNSVELDLVLIKSIPNLSLLSSGSLSTSHPLAIIDTPHMESTIRNLSSKYDYVIIDTPAIRSNPDAVFLSKFSDGMLLVVRPNISTLDSADYLKEILKQSGQTVFAQVINGVKWKNKTDSQNSIQLDGI